MASGKEVDYLATESSPDETHPIIDDVLRKPLHGGCVDGRGGDPKGRVSRQGEPHDDINESGNDILPGCQCLARTLSPNVTQIIKTVGADPTREE